MYGFMTLLAGAVEAGITATARGFGRARTARALLRAQPRTCADIARAGAFAADGRTASMPIAEVRAQVVLGPGGPVTAPLSGIECAWYLVQVRERFRVWHPGPIGPGRLERQVTVARQLSARLAVRDDTGGLRVDAMGAEYFLGPPSYHAFEERVGGDGTLMAELARVFGTPLRSRHGTMTVGFLVEEWVLREGDELRIVGQARSEIGEVVLAKPALRPFVVAAPAHAPVPIDRRQR
ncbi:MAG: GIDE domain-containing protein [Actinomadura sp.]